MLPDYRDYPALSSVRSKWFSGRAANTYTALGPHTVQVTIRDKHPGGTGNTVTLTVTVRMQ